MSQLTAAKARYASVATQTVSPARLLTMLYDRLAADLLAGEDAMLSGDIAGTGEALTHAAEILLELHSTLDTEAWPEGESLGRLYLWMVTELMNARLKNQPGMIADCRRLVLPLRDAWHEAATAQATGPVAAAPTTGPIPSVAV
jgi:flagellar protein FliS